jgi:hypothetical protein
MRVACQARKGDATLMLDQYNHTQTIPPFPLSTLLAHPDVQDGLRTGALIFQEGFFEEDHEKAWNEQDIIQFVNQELSVEVRRRELIAEQILGGPSLSYLHHLGFALGYLDQALRNKEAVPCS